MKNKKSTFRKSIGVKIGGIFLVAFLAVISTVFVVFIKQMNDTVRKDAVSSIKTIASQTVKLIESEIKNKAESVKNLSELSVFIDGTASYDEQFRVIKRYANNNEYLRILFCKPDGTYEDTTGKTGSVKGKDFYEKGIKATQTVTGPMKNEEGAVTMLYASPIIDNRGSVSGIIVAEQSARTLSNLISDIKIFGTGEAYIINEKGTIIAFNSQEGIKDYVNTEFNVQEASKEDKGLEPLAKLEAEAIKGKSNSISYIYGNDNKHAVATYIPSRGWALVVNTFDKDMFASATEAINILCGVFAAGIAIFVVIIIFSSKNIKSSFENIKDAIETFAQGDFVSDIKIPKKQDEVQDILISISESRDTLKSTIKTVIDSTGALGRESGKLDTTSEELVASSDTISKSMVETSKGNEIQSEDMVEINETFEEFGTKVVEMIESINEIDESMDNIDKEAIKSNQEMQSVIEIIESFKESFKEFILVIDEMNKKVDGISKFTAIIDAIAEQTNLLALNAAIEAARAGDSGKGFAVVAEEIRVLATQSKEASSEIINVIGEVLKNSNEIVTSSKRMELEVQSQQNSIEETIKVFENILKLVNDVQPKVELLNNRASEIDSSKGVIGIKIESVTAVSEEILSTTEEVTASSEELNNASLDIKSAIESLNNISKELQEKVSIFKI